MQGLWCLEIRLCLSVYSKFYKRFGMSESGWNEFISHSNSNKYFTSNIQVYVLEYYLTELSITNSKYASIKNSQ